MASYAPLHPDSAPAITASSFDRVPWAVLCCGAAGFATPFTVKLAGNFPVSEWLLLITACGGVMLRLLRRRWPDGAPTTRWFTGLVVLQLVGLCAYVASDIYRGSAPQDYIRGWARMAFVAIDLIGIACLVGASWRRFIVLIAGMALGQAVNVIAFGPLFDDWWKFGFAIPVTYVVLIVVSRWGRLPATLAALALGLLHIALESRSLGLECLLVAGGLYFSRFSRAWKISAIIAVWCVILLAVSGVLDEETASPQLNRHSSDAERRAMLEVAAEAFAESPFIGHGSWFSATHLVRKIEARHIQLSQTFTGYTEDRENELSVHSQLLTSLAEGGLFGGSFFLAYGLLLIWALIYCLRSDRAQQAIVLLLIVEALWNLAISPFSGPARVQIAAVAVLGLLLWQHSRGRLLWENDRS